MVAFHYPPPGDPLYWRYRHTPVELVSNHCRNCLNVQLFPQHTLSNPCQTFQNHPKRHRRIVFSDKAVKVAEVVFDSFGVI
ncbi:hypothetical protein TNCV_4904031 [Trichonephila clavipes]|nr:hypothetical protein TNCV_4904031 [Trichonephila clavipes]